MKNKDKILALVNSYAATCGGDPDGADVAEREATIKQLTDLLTAPETVQEAIRQVEGYLLAQSKAQMATGLLSGAEGNMLFKLSQIKDFLGVSDAEESKG